MVSIHEEEIIARSMVPLWRESDTTRMRTFFEAGIGGIQFIIEQKSAVGDPGFIKTIRLVFYRSILIGVRNGSTMTGVGDQQDIAGLCFERHVFQVSQYGFTVASLFTRVVV